MYQLPKICYRHYPICRSHSLCQNNYISLPINVNYLNEGDNTSIVSWNSKGALCSPKTNPLRLIVYSVMINNLVKLKRERINRINTNGANKILHVYSKSK